MTTTWLTRHRRCSIYCGETFGISLFISPSCPPLVPSSRITSIDHSRRANFPRERKFTSLRSIRDTPFADSLVLYSRCGEVFMTASRGVSRGRPVFATFTKWSSASREYRYAEVKPCCIFVFFVLAPPPFFLLLSVYFYLPRCESNEIANNVAVISQIIRLNYVYIYTRARARARKRTRSVIITL